MFIVWMPICRVTGSTVGGLLDIASLASPFRSSTSNDPVIGAGPLSPIPCTMIPKEGQVVNPGHTWWNLRLMHSGGTYYMHWDGGWVDSLGDTWSLREDVRT
jgi:hypothetical protein